MTTTIVRDSIVGDAWIEQTARAVPIQKVIDQESGVATGDILTGPVRLAFETLFELPTPNADNEKPKYGASLLFTPFADFTVMHEAYNEVCARDFASYYDTATGQYLGLHSPFRDQAEKAKFGGFTPGCVFITSTTRYKPPVVDARHNPIVDRAKVYPGVWAICAVKAYSYDDKRKKGIGFGLESVMIIGDDTKFGGGPPDTNKTFAAAKGAIIPPSVSAQHVSSGLGNAAPSVPGMPAPAPSPFPAAVAPGAPPASAFRAPPTTQDPRGPVPPGYTSWEQYDADLADL